MIDATQITDTRTLAELYSARDTAKADGVWWKVTVQELQFMLKSGEKDLSYANLTTRFANLYSANLESANGIYSAYAPNLSSRGASLTAGVVLVGKKIELRFWAGCKENITATQLLKYVADTHADNPLHTTQYKAAVRFIQACFKADMAAGKWDYLVDWKAPEVTTKS